MMTMTTNIVNLLGAPSSGKSTIAATLFANLKCRRANCELVTEAAKDYVYEENQRALDCQPYIFGKQLWRIERLIGKVDLIICDSPILLSAIYNKKHSTSFTQSVLDIFNQFHNINFFFESDPKKYNNTGRIHNLEQCLEIEKQMLKFLDDNTIPYEFMPKKMQMIAIIERMKWVIKEYFKN